MQSVTLRTERLVLQRLTEPDIPALVAGLNELSVSRWLTIVPYPYGPEDARDFLTYLDGRAPFDGFGIHAPEGLVGVVGIDDTLGYWLARAHHAKGYMSEAARALVGHYFAETGVEQLGSGYFEGNAASAAVLRKLGFDAAGEDRVKSRAQGIEVTMKKMVLPRATWQASHAD